MKRTLAVLLCAIVSGCGSTGGSLVTFGAQAAGPSDAVAGAALQFSNAVGYQVTLTRARIHIGAVYLNASMPSSGLQATGCTLPGIYVGQVTSPLDVDVLSPNPQPFPADGVGSSLPALAGEVWLNGGDINALDDTTVIVDVAGTATRAGTSYPFVGQVTIGQNRLIPVQDPRYPGANPLCKQRIVTPIPADLTLAQGGTLLLRIDPRPWFATVEFSQLSPDPADPATYRFLDETQGAPNVAFYNAIRSNRGVYTFNWQSP